MRRIGRWLGCGAATALLGLAALPAWAAEMDLTIQVRTARPTTVLPMRYRVLSNAGEDNEATGVGNDGTTALTMSLHVNTPSWASLNTPLGAFDFSIAADGSLSVPAGSRMGVSGTTLTIDNAVDLPDFGFRMRNPTTLQSFDVTPQVAWSDWRVTSGITGGTKTLAGSTATTPETWPLLGVVPGTQVTLLTTIGGIVDCRVTEAGTLAVTADLPEASDVPASLDAAAPQVVVIENTVHIDGLSVRLDRRTNVNDLTYQVTGNGSMFPSPDGLPGNAALPGQIRISPDTAHTEAARFPLHGLVPGQPVNLTTRLGSLSMRVASDASLSPTWGALPFRFEGSALVIENAIDVPGFRVRAANETNATTIGIYVGSFFGEPSRGEHVVPGGEATTGVAVPILGVTPDLSFGAVTSYASAALRVNASGGVELIAQAVSGSCELLEEPDGPVLLLNNPRSARVRAYGEHPVTEVRLGGAPVVWAGVSSFWMDRIDPGTFNIGEKEIDGAHWTDGLEFRLEGMGLLQVIGVNTYYGPNNAYGIGFRLESDGTGTFLAPAHQVTPWLGALDVDANFDGVNDNVFYVELAPLNCAPTATLSTGNFTIPSTAQATTVVSATAADADGTPLTYRWYVDDVLVSGPAAPVDGATSLDLGALGALAVGDHTIRLEVSDGELAAMPSIVLTIENSPPTVVATGSGVFEIGAASSVALGGTVSDHDGDEVTYEWLLDGAAVPGASGTVATMAGGAPVAVPPCSIGTTAIGIGVHTLTLVVEDELNAPVSSSVTVEVKDTTGPTLAPVASTRMLWPPNHEMVNVTIAANALDASGGAVTLTVVVTSDEPPEFDGTGNFLPDHEVVSVNQATGAIDLRLRAERSGKGDGRTYTVLITATDSSGNVSTATVVVKAPHDRRSR